jgi:predicted transcriptional regulator
MVRTQFEKILSDFHSVAAFILAQSGKSQTKIGGILGVTQPAVSQYKNNARGWRFVDDSYREKIGALIETLDENDVCAFRLSLYRLVIDRYEQICRQGDFPR